MALRPRWLAGVVLLLGAGGALAVARLAPTAEAGRASPLPGLAACVARPAVGPGAAARPGTFFKLQGSVDGQGAITGQHLVVGSGGQAKATQDLPVEAAASGPVDGVVAIAADDGRRSSIRLVGVSEGCSATVYTTDAVVRRTILDPADGSILFHELDRASRADLGVWRLGAAGAIPTRVLEPLPAALGMGTVWATDLELDTEGRLLAVQSCVDRGCLTRIVDLGASGLPPIVVRGSRQGPMLGFAGNRLITWAVCDGFPCAVLAWDPAAAAPVDLIAAAGAAGLTGNGRLLVALATDGSGERATVVDLTTGQLRALHGVATGDRPIAAGGLAPLGLEVAPDQLAIASRAGDPHAIRPSAAGEVLP